MEQLGIIFPAARPAKHAQRDEQKLVECLCNEKDWKPCAEIEAALGWDDRKVRRVASASDFIIGRIGTTGYKYIRNATPDDVEHFKNARLSSAKDQIRGALRKVRVWHSGRKFEPVST